MFLNPKPRLERLLLNPRERNISQFLFMITPPISMGPGESALLDRLSDAGGRRPQRGVIVSAVLVEREA
jgi:hypothetical protein